MAKNAKKTNALGVDLDPSSFQKALERENDRHTDTHTDTDTAADTHTPADTHTDAHTDTDISKRETKKKRTYGLVKQSVYEKIVAHAEATGTSYNAIVCDLLDEYIERNKL